MTFNCGTVLCCLTCCVFFKDFYSVPRTILPHGASFHGHLLTLNVTYESTKDTFTVEVGLH